MSSTNSQMFAFSYVLTLRITQNSTAGSQESSLLLLHLSGIVASLQCIREQQQLYEKLRPKTKGISFLTASSEASRSQKNISCCSSFLPNLRRCVGCETFIQFFPLNKVQILYFLFCLFSFRCIFDWICAKTLSRNLNDGNVSSAFFSCFN